MPQTTLQDTQAAPAAQTAQATQTPSSGTSAQVSVPASALEIGQSLLMNGQWREVLDIETPDDEQGDLKVVLNPNLPGTRFLKLSPARPVQMRQAHD